eukprot:scaffold25360_cov122-Isochrysis_galbana.AAC.3
MQPHDQTSTALVYVSDESTISGARYLRAGEGAAAEEKERVTRSELRGRARIAVPSHEIKFLLCTAEASPPASRSPARDDVFCQKVERVGRVDAAGEPKVGDLQVAVFVHKEIRRLQVSVQNIA